MYEWVPRSCPYPGTLGRMLAPGVSDGTTNIDILRWAGSSGSVTASKIKNEAKLACEENHFSPLMTHSSPSSSARVTNCVGSEPPCGSVMEQADTISLLSSGCRYFSFNSSEP